MILSTIFLVLAAGSAVLAADLACPAPMEIKTVAIPFTMIQEKHSYCGSYVVGQKQQFCELDLKQKATSNDEADFIMKYYVKGETEIKTLGINIKTAEPGVYSTTLDPADNRKITTYSAGISKDMKCFAYVKSFCGGSFGGTEDTGIFGAVVCDDVKDCKIPANEAFITKFENDVLGGKKLQKPNWETCGK